MQTERLISSYFAIDSPRNKNAIIVAKMGEVLFKNATFDNDIILMAVLNMKKVIVPEIDLMITSFH